MSEKAGSSLSRLAAGLPVLLALLSGTPAWAQMGGMSPGMGGMGRPGMGPQQSSPEKDEGPAEAAPDAEDQAAESKENEDNYVELARRRTKVVEIDGYFRLRTDYLYKMNLDQGYNRAGPGPSALPPFPTPSECMAGPPSTDLFVGCDDKGMGSGNIRLRLEPTINISDQVRVNTQIDVFDNMILGSTPDSLIEPYAASADQNPGVMQTTSGAPTDALSTTQTSSASNIIAKRAWGEIDTEVGSIRFGRMPWHFGRGMYFNRGDCSDCEGGTTVDRVMGLATIYGHQLQLGIDFGSQGYHIGYTDLGRKNLDGIPLDLTQKDDVTQYMLAITRIDEPTKWRERIAAGELVVNYGAQLVYRSQDYATFNVVRTTGSEEALTANDLGNSNTLTVGVDALLFIPSLWLKLGWKALTVEVEGTLLAGKLSDAGPLRLDTTQDKGLAILQAGWVLASQLKLYNDSLFIGFETGGATGDQAELAYDPRMPGSSTNGLYYPYLNYRWKAVPQPGGDRNLNDFHFSPEYHVDEILYRRILGTVSNAIYVKPSLAYWLAMDSQKNREVGLSGSVIYSLAPVRVATPGNSLSYGVEMDLGLQYRNLRENVFAGMTWGVFWPMAALSRPRVDAAQALWNHAEDANAAQVVRLFLGIKF